MTLPPTPPEFSENPYAATFGTALQSPQNSSLFPLGGGLVNMVMVVSILQIVFGTLELLMAMLLFFYAGFVGLMMPNMKNGSSPPPPPEVMFWIGIGLSIGGLLVLVFAALRIVSGIGGFRYKNRQLMLVSLIGGMVTIFTCYCAPFAIGIGIFGLIVMFDPSVKRAFEMASAGTTAEEINAQFAIARYGFAPASIDQSKVSQ